jgi:hypothetical protein
MKGPDVTGPPAKKACVEGRKDRKNGRIGLLQRERDGVALGRHVFNRTEQAGPRAEIGIARPVEREDDILSGDRRAIGELEAGPQGQRDRLSIGGNRMAFGKAGHDGAVRTVAQQRFVEGVDHPQIGIPVGIDGVDDRRIVITGKGHRPAALDGERRSRGGKAKGRAQEKWQQRLHVIPPRWSGKAGICLFWILDPIFPDRACPFRHENADVRVDPP